MPPLVLDVVPWLLAACAGIWAVYEHFHRRKEVKEARRKGFQGEQLERFYSPALGKLDELRAKTVARVDFIRESAEARDAEPHRYDVEEFKEMIEFHNQRMREDILPLHGQVVDLFRDQRALVEPSTMEHYDTLIRFVDAWQFSPAARSFEVASLLRGQQTSLVPLHDDVRQHVERLRKQALGDED